MSETGEIRKEDLDPEAEARRRLALAQIRQYPDPALRLKANEITEFDEDLARLAERMTSLMRDANGVGLAGTQVGVLRRLFVFQPDEATGPLTVVNPEILERSEETEEADEGCLSIQGVIVPVERSTGITLTGRDVAGGELSLELEGPGARVAQHELDHLDGTLVLDRTNAEARRVALAILRPEPVLTLTA